MRLDGRKQKFGEIKYKMFSECFTLLVCTIPSLFLPSRSVTVVLVSCRTGFPSTLNRVSPNTRYIVTEEHLTHDPPTEESEEITQIIMIVLDPVCVY